jgi:mannose-1-phosphate guanylyltransferase / phosphomannomutase
MSKIMKILVLADRPAASLFPRGAGCSIPLLPIANKPMIEHVLETIAAHHAANVVVRLGSGDWDTKRFLEDRAWPDMTLIVEEEATSFVDEPTLVVRADIFPSPRELGAALKEAMTEGELKSDFSRFGISWLKTGEAVPSWGFPDLPTPELVGYLPNLIAYHSLAVAAARGAAAGLNPGGWLEEDGLRAGVGAQVRTRRAVGRPVEVGAHALVDDNVSLGDDTIIGQGCYIARGAQLENVIVLPNASIRPGIRLKNMVVGGDWQFCVDSGAVEYSANPLETRKLAG